MKIAYLDTISGISGDMTLGAFLSAAVSVDSLLAELNKLGVSGFELDVRHVEHSGIVATKVQVLVSEQPKYHRHLEDIRNIIEASTLSRNVKVTAEKIFYEVGIAEAKVHNVGIDKIHFHEVGALDSLVDIVGTAICLELCGIEAVYSSPVKLGQGGLVSTEHGKMPTPTPATVEILKTYPTILTDIDAELTTPTGAAIIKALSKGVLSTERLTIESVGYGAGTKELKQTPNLLRVMIGDLQPSYDHDDIVSIETNIDDMNPEIHPYVVDKILEAGAHDAYLIPVLMKKGRPGMLLSTLAERSKLDTILGIIFRETTTLGVRIQPVERRKVQRSQREITTSLGVAKMKVVIYDGREMLVPEFEECKRLAKEKGLALREVYRILEKEVGG